MDASSSNSRKTVRFGGGSLSLGLTLVGVGLVAAALAVTASQVEVTDGDLDVTRACGSVFDGLADRSGWETWWAGDLDEPDDSVRSALVRTTHCPGAVNQGIVVAGLLGAVGVAAIVVATWRRVRGHERRLTDDAEVGRRLTRLGLVTSYVGAGLTVAGLVGIVLLLADADSTLFLYTDRAVVGVVGLVVLVPAIALFAMGRALAIAARNGELSSPRGQEVDDA